MAYTISSTARVGLGLYKLPAFTLWLSKDMDHDQGSQLHPPSGFAQSSGIWVGVLKVSAHSVPCDRERRKYFYSSSILIDPLRLAIPDILTKNLWKTFTNFQPLLCASQCISFSTVCARDAEPNQTLHPRDG
jgi:hypothetical protein